MIDPADIRPEHHESMRALLAVGADLVDRADITTRLLALLRESAALYANPTTARAANRLALLDVAQRFGYVADDYRLRRRFDEKSADDARIPLWGAAVQPGPGCPLAVMVAAMLDLTVEAERLAAVESLVRADDDTARHEAERARREERDRRRPGPIVTFP